jgi:hypothetical protein
MTTGRHDAVPPPPPPPDYGTVPPTTASEARSGASVPWTTILGLVVGLLGAGTGGVVLVRQAELDRIETTAEERAVSIEAQVVELRKEVQRVADRLTEERVATAADRAERQSLAAALEGLRVEVRELRSDVQRSLRRR